MAWRTGNTTPNFAISATATTYQFSGWGIIVPAGQLMVLCGAGAANPSGATATCADNSSQAGTANSWTAYTFGTGTCLGIVAWSYLTRPLLTGDTVTITSSITATNRVGFGQGFYNNLGVPTLDRNDAYTATGVSTLTGATAAQGAKGGELGIHFSAVNLAAQGQPDIISANSLLSNFGRICPLSVQASNNVGISFAVGLAVGPGIISDDMHWSFPASSGGGGRVLTFQAPTPAEQIYTKSKHVFF